LCGFRRESNLAPVPYPVACHPQAWSAASVFMVLQALLGIEVRGFERRLVIHRPMLPPWLDWLGDRGWRLAALELERTVTTATRQLLSDQAALAGAIDKAAMSASDLQELLTAASRQAAQLDDGSAARDILSGLIDRVELRRDGIELTLDLRTLMPPGWSAAQAHSHTITRLVPMQMKRRGVETRLVIPGEINAPARSDPALLRTVARAYCWFTTLACGKALSTRQIAAREGLSHSYVCHAISLGLLAQPIVEAICAGRQFATLTAERLKDHHRLPLAWDAQQRALDH
jgi:hypothetical protein